MPKAESSRQTKINNLKVIQKNLRSDLIFMNDQLNELNSLQLIDYDDARLELIREVKKDRDDIYRQLSKTRDKLSDLEK